MSAAKLDAFDKALVELKVEEARAIQVSHAYTDAKDQPSAEKMAHYVDGIRHAVRKLEAVMRGDYDEVDYSVEIEAEELYQQSIAAEE